jgi:predicted RNA-binding protein with PIN domain
VRDLIIDGYNVLHSSERYSGLMERDFPTARDRLVDDVASFAAGAWRATVVFDGGGRGGEETATLTGGVGVVFSAAGVTADAVIERLAKEVREAKGEAIVVTADATTQWTVIGEGITRMSSREFVAEMTDDRGDRAESERSGSRRGTVEERLCAETRSGLLRIRDRQERKDGG